ncbi:MAG TPA: TIGR01244 family sulfur transferase [Caldimonas sp.]|nr:TIGR01244 family sulfur transferase [Caldimonas sp.]
MTLQTQRLDADVCVAGQLETAAMAEAAAAGFRSVINNRPDFEGGPGQPTSEAMAAAAAAAGLSYAFLPVAGGYQSPEEIARFAQLLASMPKPILAFCRSGARSGKLWQAATAG